MNNRTTEFCKYCYKIHKLYYRIANFNSKHLVYDCDNLKKKRIIYLPFVPNLPIPEFKTMRVRKEEAKKQNLALF